MQSFHLFKKAALAASIVLSLVACTTGVGEFSESTNKHSKDLEEWKKRMSEPRDQRVKITDMPVAGQRVALQKHRWLKDKRISLAVSKTGGGVTAQTLAMMLKENGIEVMSSLPLDGYHYNGFGVRNVDGETALRMLFGPMGLDYDINDENQYVVITPNRAKTFYLKFGERKSKYESGSISGNVGTTGSGSSSSSSSSGSSSGSSGQASLIMNGVETGLDTGEGKINIDSDFWGNLEKELDALLTQCIPTASAVSVSSLPPLPLEMGGSGMMGGMMPPSMPTASAASASESLCADQKIGNFALNATTGAVTVQAPHWILDSVGKYLDNVKKDNSVTLVYEGMLISVTTSREKSEGIDLAGFMSFANGELGMAVSNNALGGVTVSPSGDIKVGGSPVADTILGIKKLKGNPAQAFLAYLEANSEYSIKQKPRVAVTNGMPGEFGQYDTLYYTQISQNTTGGASSAVGGVVATSNQLVPFKVGSLIRIVPYYDDETGYVRSPITFTQSVQTGTYETTQYITAGDTTTPIPSVIPLIRDSNYSGEVLMKDGDMLIIGGQVSESGESSGSGLPGYNAKGNWISGLMGVKRHKDQVSTYYLALTLRVNK